MPRTRYQTRQQAAIPPGESLLEARDLLPSLNCTRTYAFLAACAQAFSQHVTLKCSACVQEALKAQQQAARRHGRDALPHCERAVERFQQASKAELALGQREDARVLAADALQHWAQQVRRPAAVAIVFCD